MNKKIIALVLAALMVVMCFAFAGCGGSGAGSETSGSDSAGTSDAGDPSTSDLAYVKDKGKLVVGITDYKPMNYKEKGSDEWTGFDTEFAQKVCAELGIEAEFIVIDWDNRYFELESKTIDCVWNGMTIVDEALKNSSVTKPYAKNAQVVVMAADKLDSYPDADSIKDLSFAVEKGSAGEKELVKLGIENYTAVQYQTDALLEVKSGSVDACVIDITMANASTGEGTSYSELGYKIELSTEEYGISFRKGSDLTDTVNGLIDKFKQDGTLDELAKKYEITIA